VRGVVSDPAAIADHLGNIGISNDSHVVLVPAGISSAEVATATRVYWTLNYLGHEEVSILNGGMSAYLKDLDKDGNPTNPLQEGMVELEPSNFIAAPKPEMIATAEAVEGLMSDGAVPVDNRPHDFYLGVNKSGSAKAAGTIPGSKNLPHTWLTTDGKGSFRNAETLAKLYEAAGVSTAGKQINFCNTGHLGSIGWFVSHELLGNEAAILFDGSMAEWTHSGRDVEQKIRF
jgi:thiosulfate/3-mercaptopyruvate sulfurtransferase